MDLTFPTLWPSAYSYGYIPNAVVGSGLWPAAGGQSLPPMIAGGQSAWQAVGAQQAPAVASGIDEAVSAWGPTQSMQQVLQLLRMIESSYVLDEILHSFYVEAARHPELAGDPALPRFAHHSLQALQAKIAAAGYLRRMLAGETGHEVISGLQEQLRNHTQQLQQTLRQLRELTDKPAIAQVPAVRIITNVMGYHLQAHQLLAQHTPAVLGITLESIAIEAPEA